MRPIESDGTPNSWGYRQSRPVDHAIALRAERQHGVVAQRQLVALGLSQREIDYRVRVGRLQRLHRGVYAVGHACLTDWGDFCAAVLAVGGRAAADGPSALALWGVRERRAGEPVYVRVDRQVRAPLGVRVSSVRELQERDVTTRHNIRVLMPGPALLQSASILGARDLRRGVNQALVERRTSMPALIDLVARNRRRRGVGKLAAVLADARPTRSDLEDALVAFLDAWDFHGYETNAKVGADEVDILFRAQRLVIEADGRQFHDNPIARANDAAKQARLEAAGHQVERVGWKDVTVGQAGTARRLRPLRPASA